ncbi:hypothetical protein [Catellatospora chokoriensis]|uniref:Uncharacterized protein n=1 Tax=Catellatospora chokoriensis TaxID=310353 RepID=A0A8J3K8G7_9ACTN|nr:hypothetical protein [Catellatospora chokoriensis]GIF94822.1 hypothetical protein Cch02nite_82660 [Catellatospora chokoriensis]
MSLYFVLGKWYLWYVGFMCLIPAIGLPLLVWAFVRTSRGDMLPGEQSPRDTPSSVSTPSDEAK